MAIDTASKRASALGFAFVALTLVVPDGALDQGDRQTIAHSYSGILATVAVDAPDKTFGVLSIIQTRGLGVSSLVTTSLGVSSAMDSSQGLLSVIQSRGLGVTSSINSSLGVESEI